MEEGARAAQEVQEKVQELLVVHCRQEEEGGRRRQEREELGERRRRQREHKEELRRRQEEHLGLSSNFSDVR